MHGTKQDLASPKPRRGVGWGQLPQRSRDPHPLPALITQEDIPVSADA